MFGSHLQLDARLVLAKCFHFSQTTCTRACGCNLIFRVCMAIKNQYVIAWKTQLNHSFLDFAVVLRHLWNLTTIYLQ